MRPQLARAEGLSGEVIAVAIEVHRMIRPELLERIYGLYVVRGSGYQAFTVLTSKKCAAMGCNAFSCLTLPSSSHFLLGRCVKV